MEKKRFWFFAIAAAGIFIGYGDLLWAQPPSIQIRLELHKDKPFYRYGEPVKVTVSVRNNSMEDIYISKEFKSKLFYQEIRVIDPAGRLLMAKRKAPHEIPDAPPLPFVLYNGRLVRAAPCEKLEKYWSIRQTVDNISKYYSMKLPGYYSAHVRVSAMVFNKEICDIHGYKWLGLLKSETKYFYTEGNTKVAIIPDKWRLSWRKAGEGPQVQVNIYPGEEKRIDNYRAKSIRLNNVTAEKVVRSASMLSAYFEAKKCIESLGQVKMNRPYPVVISGRLKSDQPFGGGKNITVVD